jgi:signal transduction histidine kinase/ligand-binding sensor domain-containing protein
VQSALWIAAFGLPSVACALSPHLSLRQLHHTSWLAHDGAPTGIESLAQTSDGYIWVAASAGLFRFDGVRFERIDEVDGHRLPSNNVVRLFAPRSGGLWIGYRFGGASFIANGTVRSFGAREGLPGGTVTDFAQDQSGAVWANTTRGLKRLDGASWQEVRERLELPSEYVNAMRVARDGTLWVVVDRKVMSLAPGRSAFSATDIRTSDEDVQFVEMSDGTLLLADQKLGVHVIYLPGGQTTARHSWIPVRDARDDRLWGQLVDRDGVLWLTASSGIHRLSDAARLSDPEFAGAASSDAYANVDGLATSDFLEDREGNIWIGTASGLHRFRESRLTPVEFPRAADGFAIAAGDAGAMLVGIDSEQGAFHLDGNAVRQIAPGPQSITSVYRGDDGVAWFGGRGTVWRSSSASVADSMWIAFAAPIERANASFYPVQAMTQDKAGRLWVSMVRGGVYRLDGSDWVHVGKDASLTLATDADGRVWLGYPGGRIRLVDANDVTVHDLEADLGNILSIHARTANVWIGGELGLARFDGSRFHAVALHGNRSLSSVSGIVITAEGHLWLNTSDGAISIAADEVRRLSADPRYAARYDLYNYLDGMSGTPTSIRPLPSMAAGTDGRLWFATTNGITWIDPKASRRNTLAPNVEVQSIVADGTRFRPHPDLQLPVGARDLQIDYTALSLSVPERVRFRYQLGPGGPWQDAGPRRTAYFTDLSPGAYVFRVIAANNDGAWNEAGATLAFSIPPPFHQTRWFYAACVLTGVGLLTAIYRVRMRQVSAQVRDRLEARLSERERIARDLHDTLLQGVQGLIWRFQAAADRIPSGDPARTMIEQSLDRADRLLGESRDKVKDLRPAASGVVDLAQALAAEGEQLSKLHSARFAASVQGTSREIHPIVREEALLISREAMSNAFRHAQANSIEAELTYSDAALHVRIRDDGQGIDGTILKAGERPGHFGLIGMHERAKKLGAHIDVWSKPGAGTEVDLRIPANVAYKRHESRPRGIRLWLSLFDSSVQRHQ